MGQSRDLCSFSGHNENCFTDPLGKFGLNSICWRCNTEPETFSTQQRTLKITRRTRESSCLWRSVEAHPKDTVHRSPWRRKCFPLCCVGGPNCFSFHFVKFGLSLSFQVKNSHTVHEVSLRYLQHEEVVHHNYQWNEPLNDSSSSAPSVCAFRLWPVLKSSSSYLSSTTISLEKWQGGEWGVLASVALVASLVRILLMGGHLTRRGHYTRRIKCVTSLWLCRTGNDWQTSIGQN